MVDRLEFAEPCGPVGRLAERVALRPYPEHLIAARGMREGWLGEADPLSAAQAATAERNFDPALSMSGVPRYILRLIRSHPFRHSAMWRRPWDVRWKQARVYWRELVPPR